MSVRLTSAQEDCSGLSSSTSKRTRQGSLCPHSSSRSTYSRTTKSPVCWSNCKYCFSPSGTSRACRADNSSAVSPKSLAIFATKEPLSASSGTESRAVSALIPDTQRSRIRATACPGSGSSFFLSSIPFRRTDLFPLRAGQSCPSSLTTPEQSSRDGAAPPGRAPGEADLGAAQSLRASAVSSGTRRPTCRRTRRFPSAKPAKRRETDFFLCSEVKAYRFNCP